MPFTAFPRGVSSFGAPVIPGLWNLPPRDGKVIFVDASRGSSVSSGLDPNEPKATITQAHTLASAGDTIYVFPGSYNESLTITKDYISIIGAVQGYGKPDWTNSATGNLVLDVNAQGFVLARMRLYSSGALPTLGAAAGRAVRIRGNGFHIEDCVFDGDSNDNLNSVLVGLKGDPSDNHFTASEGRILRSLFRGTRGFVLAFETGEPPTNGVGSTHCEVVGNRFIDNNQPDIVSKASVAGGGAYSVQDVLIAGNYFMSAKNKATWMDFTTSSDGGAAAQDGCIADNFFADDNLDATAVAMVGTGFTFVGNYDTVGVQDGSGFD